MQLTLTPSLFCQQGHVLSDLQLVAFEPANLALAVPPSLHVPVSPAMYQGSTDGSLPINDVQEGIGPLPISGDPGDAGPHGPTDSVGEAYVMLVTAWLGAMSAQARSLS